MRYQKDALSWLKLREINLKHKLPVLKSNGGVGGGMSGMTTSGRGAGLVTVGMGSYPKTRKKKKRKSLPIEKTRKPGARDIKPRKRRISRNVLEKLALYYDATGKTMKEFVEEAKKKGATNDDLKNLFGWPAPKTWLFRKKPI